MRYHLLTAAALTVACATAPARADFVLVDDLDSRNLGRLNGQGNFTSLPDNTGIINVVEAGANGRAIQVGPLSNNEGRAFFNNNAAFAVGGEGEEGPATLFFQVSRSTGNVDVSYGLGAAPTFSSDFEAFDAQFRVTGSTGNVSARNGGAFTGTLATIAADTFFNVYLVVDTVADRYDVYLTGADKPAADATDRIATNLALRSPGTINSFLGISGPVTETTRVDNLFVDADAANLTNPLVAATPIPEPASVAAVGLLGGLLLRRRR